MTWHHDGPQGDEAAKIKHLLVPYTRGRGLDVGCGPYKAFPHFLAVDNLHHAKVFGWPVEPNTINAEATDLSMFASGSLDFVFSSHVLEHCEDHRKALKEWWRVIRPGGHLCLYLPHKELYPNIGQPGANHDHKHDFTPEDIERAMRGMSEGWDMVENEVRAGGNEYSFFQAFRKRADLKFNIVPWQRNPDGKKRALVIRYGGIGDALIAASVFPGLKAQGYHVTVQATPDCQDIIKHDPHVDEWWVQDKDQVPNQELGRYWRALEERFDRIVNLCESVEGGLLAMPGRVQHLWPQEVRHALLNVNYLERTHDLAGVPHDFAQRFYPSPEEAEWARRQRQAIGGGYLIVWALAGSSIHKAYPWTDVATAMLMKRTNARIVFVGDEKAALLEAGAVCGFLMASGFGNDAVRQIDEAKGLPGLLSLARKHWGEGERLVCTSGKWSIRQSLAFAQVADCVVGPETGVLNGVALAPMRKVLMLSHSSHENLTKHWVNTAAIEASPRPACSPCHQLHYGDEFCPRNRETGAAECATAIKPQDLVAEIIDDMQRHQEAA